MKFDTKFGSEPKYVCNWVKKERMLCVSMVEKLASGVRKPEKEATGDRE